MSIDDFSSVEIVREYVKQSIYQMLDGKIEEIPKFPHIFRDFPDSNKLDFGFRIGAAISVIMTEAIKKEVNMEFVNTGVLEAIQDIHDDLKERYSKL